MWYRCICNAWFTFSLRQHKTRQKRECKGCIRLVYHVLNMFLSHLKALGKMSVNQSLVKGNENVLTLSPSSHPRVWMSTFVHTSFRSHFAKNLDEWISKSLFSQTVSKMWKLLIESSVLESFWNFLKIASEFKNNCRFVWN